jgi:hypothetical protein
VLLSDREGRRWHETHWHSDGLLWGFGGGVRSTKTTREKEKGTYSFFTSRWRAADGFQRWRYSGQR